MSKGLSFGLSLQDISDKHGVSVDEIEKQLDMGWPQEAKEHGVSDETAKHIARDHLVEDANYYTKLKKLESKLLLYMESSGDRNA